MKRRACNQVATDDQILDAHARFPGNISHASKAAGISRMSYRERLARLDAEGLLYRHTVMSQPPTLDEPLEELIARRLRDSGRVQERLDHGEMHRVAIHETGPVGILHIGDPHVDDPGCNFALLWQHLQLVVDTPGLYAGILGDLQNNWVGRLARLYAVQSVSARESWRLVEAMLAKVGPRLVYLVGGNHDAWSGPGDPLQWIMRSHAAVQQAHGVRIVFSFPDGHPIIMNARHDWPGMSQFNPAFGQGKAAYQGMSDHIIVSGHRHQGGYMTYYNAHTGRLSHCCQVGSYKMLDDYADQRGFPRNNYSPSVLTIIDPTAEAETERVLVFQSVELGARVLTAMRASSKSAGMAARSGRGKASGA